MQGVGFIEYEDTDSVDKVVLLAIHEIKDRQIEATKALTDQQRRDQDMRKREERMLQMPHQMGSSGMSDYSRILMEGETEADLKVALVLGGGKGKTCGREEVEMNMNMGEKEIEGILMSASSEAQDDTGMKRREGQEETTAQI